MTRVVGAGRAMESLEGPQASGARGELHHGDYQGRLTSSDESHAQARP